MIILDAFLLELGAFFRRKFVIFTFLCRANRPSLVIFEERFAVMRTLSIGPSNHFHLQHAKIDPQLQFLSTIEPGDLAHLDVAILVRPVLQDRIQIQTHRSRNIGHLTFACQLCRGQQGSEGCLSMNRSIAKVWPFAQASPRWSRRSTHSSVSLRSSAVFRKTTSSPPNDRSLISRNGA